MAYTRLSQQTAIDGKVTGGTFAAPPDQNHRQLLAALRAEGVLTGAGAYAAGRSTADVLRSLSVPSVSQETLDRVAKAMGL
jgi:uncharacterized protein YciI